VFVSVTADNDRFSTDVGVRDTRGDGVIRASGRAGYLQMGPNIPLKAGQYRVRWIGPIEAAPGQEMGFVDVWVDGERQIAKTPVMTGAFPAADRVLAETAFTLKRSTTDVEYRFYVNEGFRPVLERVILESTGMLELRHR
jgi:hypothetical protein